MRLTNETDPMAAYEGYHKFGEDRGEPYGSFEVFWIDGDMNWESTAFVPSGWYWAPGFPGYLHDGDRQGPFPTSRAAYLDAQDD